MAANRVTQVVSEVLEQGTANARVTQVVAEVLISIAQQTVVTVDFAIPTENLRGPKADSSVPLENLSAPRTTSNTGVLPLENRSVLKSNAPASLEAGPVLVPVPVKPFGFPGFCAIYGASVTGPPVGPPPGYSGPMDLIPGALVGYSIGRALRSAWIGMGLATLRRDSDNATQAFVALTNGKFDQAGAATFIGAGHGYGSLFNDQSGNARDLTQGTLGLQPLYTPNVLNGAPILDFFQCTGATSTDFGLMTTSGAVPWSDWAGGDFTVFMVCKVPLVSDATGGTTGLFFGQTGYGTNSSVASNNFGIHVGEVAPPGRTENSLIIGWDDGITPGWFSGPPSYSGAFALANSALDTNLFGGAYTVHEMQFTKPTSFNGTYPFNVGGASLFLYNGIKTGLIFRPGAGSGFPGDEGDVEGRYINASGTTVDYPLLLGDPNPASTADCVAANFSDGNGQVVELIVWPSILTMSQRSTIRQNIGTFYGITVVP